MEVPHMSLGRAHDDVRMDEVRLAAAPDHANSIPVLVSQRTIGLSLEALRKEA